MYRQKWVSSSVGRVGHFAAVEDRSETSLLVEDGADFDYVVSMLLVREGGDRNEEVGKGSVSFRVKLKEKNQGCPRI
ncbi:Hypothetical predicted protein [Olea europaea subsp. europaea]|uniref:Uncharacterized protein n=1 Tax=Olea europaea subsp. europaea TaxID=158383 RepID=A0A8S0SP09_OLEEU|nr:Hypothetical predicted protein [Olea europaea subsp. europaea]